MRNSRLDAELATLEAATPFLKSTLSRDEFESEISACEQELLNLARNSEEVDRVRTCVHRSLHVA